LDALLVNALPTQPLPERVARAGFIDLDPPQWPGKTPVVLLVLDRQLELHQRVARTFRSIVRGREALDLFADTVLPIGTGFMHRRDVIHLLFIFEMRATKQN
jgi:hypothetical protein